MAAANVSNLFAGYFGKNGEESKLIAFGTSGARTGDYLCLVLKKFEAIGHWNALMSSKQHLSTYTIPVFFLQMILAVLINRLLQYLLKPLRQTYIISFILGGMVLGPSFVGKIFKFAENIFPASSLTLMELTGLLGLAYHFFVLGVTMDLSVIKSTWKKGIILAFADIAVIVFIASVAYNLYSDPIKTSKTGRDFIKPRVILAVAASMTGFPVLNRILIQLRLSKVDMGGIAMSCSVVETMFAWSLLPIVDWLSPKQESALDASFGILPTKEQIKLHRMALVWVLLSHIGFIFICFFIIRPAIRFMVRRTPDGESFNEVFVTTVLGGVMLCGVVTDLFGSHLAFGPFLLGLVISHGPFGNALITKVEDFAYGIMLPLYFVVIGLRTRLDLIIASDIHTKHPFLFIVVWASIGKVVLALLVSKYYKRPYLEGIVLGLLLNTKGFIHLMVLNFGLDKWKLLGDKTYAIGICLTVLITGLIPPTILAIYKPIRNFVIYGRRSILKTKGEPELRILPCIHNPRSVPAIINLLGACLPTKQNPFSIYALHLIEQAVGHNHVPSTQMVDRSISNSDKSPQQTQSDHIIKAFTNYERTFHGVVTAHTLTIVSPYDTMHEEICNVAEDKGMAFIILPFHKQQAIDGGMEETNPFFRDINLNILNNAPCTVAILVDRGLGSGGGAVDEDRINTNLHHIVVLYFGGPDDREALCLAWKMIDTPNVSLTVIRFVPTNEALKFNEAISSDMGALKMIIDCERERQLDDDYINSFRRKTSNKQTVVFQEKLMNDGEETMTVIKSIENIHDLFIVGRGRGQLNPLTASLLDFSECPELGAIGDLLASSDFSTTTTTSVLIVQQYVGAATDGGSSTGTGTPNSQYSNLYDQFHNINQISTPLFSNETLTQRRVKTFKTSWN